MIFSHTSLHCKLQPWSQALEIVILFAFCPSLPLCNVDITLKSNTSLHYTIFQHWKGNEADTHAVDITVISSCSGEFSNTCNLSMIAVPVQYREYENVLLVHLFIFHVIYTNGNLVLLCISYAIRRASKTLEFLSTAHRATLWSTLKHESILNYLFHWFTFFVLVQMSSVFIAYLFTHLCISFSWCMSLAKLQKSDRCRKKIWLRNSKPQMWQHPQWLVSLPRSCRHKNGDHMSTDVQMWCRLPCLVEWISSYSSWGYSLKKSLH